MQYLLHQAKAYSLIIGIWHSGLRIYCASCIKQADSFTCCCRRHPIWKDYVCV